MADNHLAAGEQTATKQSNSANAQPIREAHYAQLNENGQLVLAARSADSISFPAQQDALGNCTAHRHNSP